MIKLAKCRSCGAEILFIKLKSGKYNPVDVQKRTFKEGEGKEVFVTEKGEVLTGQAMPFENGANREGYISHFATCPFANQHRKGRTEE